jgi:hypothetical protein
VPHRLLVFVSGLTFGDYLLWNWSLNSNHDVVALISGLTLPPFAVACLWLLALCLARLIAYATRRRPANAPARAPTGRGREQVRQPATRTVPPEETVASPASAGTPPGKLAA